MNFKETKNGYEFHTSYGFAFFSFGNTQWQDLPNQFTNLTFDRAKQVHGDVLVESVATTAFDVHGIHDEADAIYSREPHRAVTVVSADCLPILILNPQMVVAIHAGWRGVKNEIILKSLQKLGSDFCGHEDTIAVIGPHIQQSSFEVDRALADEFQEQYQVYRIAGSSADAISESFRPHPTRGDEKAFVNLKVIAEQQLLLAGLEPRRIRALDIDTMTDQRFASYRRDKGHNVGRNFSFATRF